MSALNVILNSYKQMLCPTSSSRDKMTRSRRKKRDITHSVHFGIAVFDVDLLDVLNDVVTQCLA